MSLFLRNEAAGSGVHPRQDAPHAHAIIPGPAVAGSDGRPAGIRFAYSADLGTDQILCHRLDAAMATLSANSPTFTKSAHGTSRSIPPADGSTP